MKRLYHCMVVVVVCFILSGCSYGSAVPLRTLSESTFNRPIMGFVYTHTVQPLDVNVNQTPIGTKESDSGIKFFNYSYFSFMWNSNAIGDIAKKNGIETIYYADLETLSIFGIWNQFTVRICGK